MALQQLALGSLASSVSSPDESTGSWLLSLLPLPYLLTQTAESLPRLPPPSICPHFGGWGVVLAFPFLPPTLFQVVKPFHCSSTQKHTYIKHEKGGIKGSFALGMSDPLMDQLTGGPVYQLYCLHRLHYHCTCCRCSRCHCLSCHCPDRVYLTADTFLCLS